MIAVHFVPTPNGHKVMIELKELAVSHRVVSYGMPGAGTDADLPRDQLNARLPATVNQGPGDGGAPVVCGNLALS